MTLVQNHKVSGFQPCRINYLIQLQFLIQNYSCTHPLYLVRQCQLLPYFFYISIDQMSPKSRAIQNQGGPDSCKFRNQFDNKDKFNLFYYRQEKPHRITRFNLAKSFKRLNAPCRMIMAQHNIYCVKELFYVKNNKSKKYGSN